MDNAFQVSHISILDEIFVLLFMYEYLISNQFMVKHIVLKVWKALLICWLTAAFGYHWHE